MNRFLLLTLVAATFVNAELGKDCHSDNQCGQDECCQILSEYMVVSKRESAGTCQSYTPEGHPCDLYGKINGYCSCYPGYSCKALEVPINGAMKDVQTRKISPPRPGYTYNITCVKDIN